MKEHERHLRLSLTAPARARQRAWLRHAGRQGHRGTAGAQLPDVHVERFGAAQAQARRGLAPPHHGHDRLGGAAAIHGAGDGRRLRQGKALHGTADLMDTLISSVKEFGEYAAECAEDIRDGRLPRDQHDRILKEGQEALASIASMMQLVRAVHAEQYGGGQ